MKLGGWSSMFKEDVCYYQCPNCKELTESLGGFNNNHMCPNCKNSFKIEEFGTVKLKKDFVECKECGNKVSLTGWNLCSDGKGYLCDNCESIVVIKFNGKFIQPTLPLDVAWNKSIKHGSVELLKNVFLNKCKTEKDLLVLDLMHSIAKEESSNFRSFSKEHQKAILLFNNKDYIGFIIWTEEKDSAVLRQLYISEKYRKKGYATQLVDFWVKNIADKINDKFGIEDPIEATLKILIKLGYAKKEGDQTKGIKCLFVKSDI